MVVVGSGSGDSGFYCRVGGTVVREVESVVVVKTLAVLVLVEDVGGVVQSGGGGVDGSGDGASVDVGGGADGGVSVGFVV